MRYMSCFDVTHAPVAAVARAAATGLVSMSTRPDPEGSGTVEIATRRCPRLRVVWDLRELSLTKPRLWSLPARLDPVPVHPTRWGVGPQMCVPCVCLVYTCVHRDLALSHQRGIDFGREGGCGGPCYALHQPVPASKTF